MTRSAATLLLACALAACSRETPPPPKAAAPAIPPQYVNRLPEPDIDSDNLLNIAYGASVVSRTGELNLEQSTAHAIDGMHLTGWVSAPGPLDEQLVFSLGAPARVLRVGLTTPEPELRASSARFEGSMDGTRWTSLGTIVPAITSGRQLAEVARPTPAQFIRVTFQTDRYYISARSLHVLGEEIAAPAAPPFTGCWTSNGVRMHLTQNRARVTGVVETDPPTYLSGGTDNRVSLVMWTQGPTWGYAAITRSPDGRHLTRYRFYEEVDSKNTGDAWFGVQCQGPLMPPATFPPAAPDVYLQRAGRYSVFGLVFDPAGRLVGDLSAPAMDSVVAMLQRAPQRRFRFTSREFRRNTPALNATESAARLSSFRTALHARGIDTSRHQLVAAGDQWIGPPIGAAVQGLLASRIDIEDMPR